MTLSTNHFCIRNILTSLVSRFCAVRATTTTWRIELRQLHKARNKNQIIFICAKVTVLPKLNPKIWVLNGNDEITSFQRNYRTSQWRLIIEKIDRCRMTCAKLDFKHSVWDLWEGERKLLLENFPKEAFTCHLNFDYRREWCHAALALFWGH